MARKLPPLLGRANVHQRRDGTLVVDTDSLRKHNALARTDGFGDVGDDDDDFGDDDDDFGDDDDDFGDDDDDFGDDDDIEGDDDDIEGDDVGARRRRRRAKGRAKGRGRRRTSPASRRAAARKKKLAAYKYPTTVSGRGVSAAIIVAGATEAELLQLTPTVTVKLNDLRIAFDAPLPVVAGVNVQFAVQQVRVGDTLVWNDNVGVDARHFAGDTTLRHMLLGRMASPAQPVFIAGSYINNGSANSATNATVSTTVTAFKKAHA